MNAGDFRQDRGGYPLEPSTATHTSEYEISCRPRGVASERALAALVRIGWTFTWQSGSHRRLKRLGLPQLYVRLSCASEDGPKSEMAFTSQVERRTSGPAWLQADSSRETPCTETSTRGMAEPP